MRDLKSCRQLAAHLRSLRVRREPCWLRLSRWIRGDLILTDRQDHDHDPDGHELALFRAAVAHALDRGAAGMTSGMTPRNVAWFKTTFPEPQLEEASGAREWLDLLDTRMRDALSSGGFYQAIHQFNFDLLWAGCALLYSEEAEPIRFECQQIGSWCVAIDQNSQLRAVLRCLKLTPAEISRAFKSACPQSITEQLEDNPYTPTRVWHLVEATNRSGPRPVDSYYWLDNDDNNFLRQSSYYEMPFFFAIWKDGPTIYGRGPGDECLADARQIDKMERDKLAGLAKLVNPPMAAPYSMKDQLDLSPGAINFITGTEQIRPLIDLQPYASALPHLQNEIDRVSGRVEHELRASIFDSVPLDQRPKDMSATEFLERKREAMQQLGPVISAYEPNVLTPLLYRVARTLDRMGLTPPLPDALQDMPVMMKIDFLSPMANALRQTGAEATRALIQDAANIFQMTQQSDILDKLDFDQAMDELARGIGAPGSIIRADDDVAQIRQERQQQMQQQQEMTESMQGLDMAKQAQDIATQAQAMQQQQQQPGQMPQ